MKKENKVAFTLVELIVVITILAILATIGFVSFSWYLAWTRDTNRIAQLKSMSDALELYRTKKDLPIPDDKVDVKSWDEVIAYQWYIWKNVLETIEYTESGLDPKDKNYFSYYLTKNKKYFQLLAFLEEEDSDVVALNNFNKTFATDYSERYPKTTWRKLWILTDEFNTPIQELPTITSSWYLDIANVWDIEYKSILKWDEVLSWTWTTFQPVKRFAEVWGKFCSIGNINCLDPNISTLNIADIFWDWSNIATYTFDWNSNDLNWNYNWVDTEIMYENWKFWYASVFNWSSSYIQLPDEIRFKAETSNTISLWLKTIQTNRFELIEQRIWSDSPDKCNFMFTINWSEEWDLRYNYPGYNDWWTEINNSDNDFYISDNEWYNIVLIKDVINNNMKIYKNWDLYILEDVEDINFDINGSLFIWKRYDDNNYFDWKIDQVRIFNRALSEDEVKKLYEEK